MAKPFSNIPSTRRRQEEFDVLQWRCNADFYAPTIAELRDAGIVEARFECADYNCLHPGPRFLLTRYWSGLNVRDLKKRQTCGSCWGRKVKLRIFLPVA